MKFYASGHIDRIDKLVTNEIKRATEEDNSINSKLTEEIDRLTEEIDRSTKADASLTSKIESLDYNESILPSETLTTITQIDGKISTTKQNI